MPLILVAGCAQNPEPPQGDKRQDEESVRGAIADCLAGSTRWRTLRARYGIDGAKFDEVVLAFEQRGRVAYWRYYDRTGYWNGAIGVGSRMYFVGIHENDRRTVGQVDVAPLLSALSDLRASRPIAYPTSDLGPSEVNWGIEVLLRGKPFSPDLELVFSLRFRHGEPWPFGWLDRLESTSHNSVEIVGNCVRTSDSAGSFLIDSKTGMLIECGRTIRAGEAVSVRLLDAQMDSALDEWLFDVSGELSQSKAWRSWCSTFALNLFETEMRGCSDLVERSSRCLQIVPVLLEMLWPREERDRLADVGRRRIDEVARGLRKENPGVAEAEIRQAAETTASKAITEEVNEELVQLCHQLLRISSLSDQRDLERLRDELETAMFRALVGPAEEAAKIKKR
ncbi:MAG: hypothetical protein HYY18_22065 [Planctomycetes bacterium]|nr:hypothetical protein [Planctomycetota bacterium]